LGASGGDKVLAEPFRVVNHFFKAIPDAGVEAARIHADIDAAKSISHQAGGRAGGQSMSAGQQGKSLRAQLRQNAVGNAEPKIAFVVLANGAHVVGPVAFVEGDGLKLGSIKAEDSASAGANPQPAAGPSHKLQMRVMADFSPGK
jgi:hypothetical protein